MHHLTIPPSINRNVYYQTYPNMIDSLGVVLNASNPESTWNKKHNSCAYHFVQENVANDVVEIRKVDTKDKYTNPFTNPLDIKMFYSFFYKVQTNWNLEHSNIFYAHNGMRGEQHN